MSRVFCFIRCSIIAVLLTSCAGQAPRVYTFDDLETFPAPFEAVWGVVQSMSESEKWRIEDTQNNQGRAYISTDWMSDQKHGGDYGSKGIPLGKANNPLNDNTQEVAISIRVVSESATSTRVKVTCLFRIQTSKGVSGTGQTMFGTSKGIVEEHILTTIRSRLATS